MIGDAGAALVTMRRRAGSATVAVTALVVALIAGCAGDGARVDSGEPAPSASSKRGTRERELDLVVPETGTVQEDLTELDDATLDQRITEANKHVNELTGKAFLHAASATDGDLGRDAQYRKLLLEAKLAENELDRLEAEKARRVRR